MNFWLGIALVAYLIGAVIEAVSTASQLTHSLPELTQGLQEQPRESDPPPYPLWQVFAVIASVSICGAFFWPCRLLHRSLKAQFNSQKD